MKRRIVWISLLVIAAVALLFALLIGVEVELAKRGLQLDFHNPPATPVKLGQGTPLMYLVLGDSTAAGQGASSYKTGIAETTARYLARNHEVTYVNLAISGARAKDVLDKEVGKAVNYKPDVVLLAIGANDVTHVTGGGSVRTSTQAVIDMLVAANCKIKIVLTGSPDMGAVPRLAQPLRALAGGRTGSLNRVFTELVAKNNLTFAPIAAKTGPQFRAHPDLFAIDKFHPDDRGYALWVPVLEHALDAAQTSQAEHCTTK